MSKLGVVEDTLFVPMLGRIYASEYCPQILYDPKALELKKKLPSSLPEQDGQSQYTLLASAARSANMDRYIRAFLERRPDGVIVQLGCGLETAYYRCDNGRSHWYAVDLPHVVEYRRELLPEPERETYLAGDAFAEDWIDVYPRKGKVGGAYCMPAFGTGEFRILTNFGGLFGDVVTLAHELGHGFHEMQIKNNGALNRNYSMPVAETASNFNENLLVSYAIDHAESDDEKLMLIENRLQNAALVVCDIYSRFLFEKEVCERRSDSFMLPDELCDIMLASQKRAYGDGLDQSTLNPYMWVCKVHYYSTDLAFYNYPYTFGGLLARGLYEKYLKEGADFLPKYKAMLRETPMLSVEDSAGICGIDVSGRDFWRGSLEALKKDIEMFKKLVKQG